MHLIDPNLHVVLLHAPLGLFIVGVLIEVFSFLGWRNSPFRAAGRWMIALGAYTMLPAALSGVYALNDVVVQGLDPVDANGTWQMRAEASPLVLDGAGWERLREHVWYQSAGTLLAVLGVTFYLGASDTIRHRLYALFLLVVVAAAGITMAGAHLGGQAVYAHGAGVASLPDPDAPAAVPEASAASDVSEDDADDTADLEATLVRWIMPLQTHIVFAGVVMALSFLSLGLAWRKGIEARYEPEALQAEADYFAAALGEPVPTEAPEPTTTTPAARFAWLTLGAVVLTSLLGTWHLAADAGTYVPAELWNQVWPEPFETADRREAGQGLYGIVPDAWAGYLTRQFVHVLTGGGLAVLTLLLALVAWLIPKQRWLTLLIGLGLVVLLGLQLWLGILMLYDQPAGPVDSFKVY
ncbi:MAG: hypothetical protein ACFCVE_10685 [Phycisphaerae bacterium]